MVDILVKLSFLVCIGVFTWFLARLIGQVQEGDRSRGNPDDWGPYAGHHW